MQWTTMASADFCHPLGLPYDDRSLAAGKQISQGKTRDFPPIHPPHYAGSLRMTSGFESMRPLAQRIDASYAVRVPRTRSLPAASFRFRLAADTLA